MFNRLATGTAFPMDRKPHSGAAAIIFTLIEQRKTKGYVSSLTFSSIYFVLLKLNLMIKSKQNLKVCLNSLGF